MATVTPTVKKVRGGAYLAVSGRVRQTDRQTEILPQHSLRYAQHRAVTTILQMRKNESNEAFLDIGYTTKVGTNVRFMNRPACYTVEMESLLNSFISSMHKPLKFLGTELLGTKARLVPPP